MFKAAGLALTNIYDCQEQWIKQCHKNGEKIAEKGVSFSVTSDSANVQWIKVHVEVEIKTAVCREFGKVKCFASKTCSAQPLDEASSAVCIDLYTM